MRVISYVETQPEKRLIGYARVSTYGQTLDSKLSTSHRRIQQPEHRAQGATLQELADSYDRSISTMRRYQRRMTNQIFNQTSGTP